jgi:hypothetical protein
VNRVAKRPCNSCPYRRDVPSGVWEAEEYEKLPPYDGETADQPPQVFMCHQQDGNLCAGWVAVHDMDESLGLRLAASMGMFSSEELELLRSYSTDVPLFDSGTEAREHGLADVETPGVEARALVEKLQRRR